MEVWKMHPHAWNENLTNQPGLWPASITSARPLSGRYFPRCSPGTHPAPVLPPLGLSVDQTGFHALHPAVPRGFPRSAPCRAGWRGGEAGNPARSDRFGHGTTGSVPLCGAVCEHAFIYRLLLPESFKGFHFLYFFFLKSSMERNCHSPASPLKRLCCWIPLLFISEDYHASQHLLLRY